MKYDVCFQTDGACNGRKPNWVSPALEQDDHGLFEAKDLAQDAMCSFMSQISQKWSQNEGGSFFAKCSSLIISSNLTFLMIVFDCRGMDGYGSSCLIPSYSPKNPSTSNQCKFHGANKCQYIGGTLPSPITLLHWP